MQCIKFTVIIFREYTLYASKDFEIGYLIHKISFIIFVYGKLNSIVCSLAVLLINLLCILCIIIKLSLS